MPAEIREVLVYRARPDFDFDISRHWPFTVVIGCPVRARSSAVDAVHH
jgi:hypothetical protein